MPHAPDFPAGPPPAAREMAGSDADWQTHVNALAAAPAQLREVVSDLSDAQLATRYKNWSIRQIVHHLADSHVNAYTRFKLALTEDWPTIRPYEENAWVNLADARTRPISVPLALFDAMHASWVGVLGDLPAAERARGYVHPDETERYPLTRALPLYAWHCRHHIAQIAWLIRGGD